MTTPKTGLFCSDQNQPTKGKTSWPRILICFWFTPLFAAAGQSMLQPASPQSQGIVMLWWWMLTVASLIFVTVVSTIAIGLWRARESPSQLSTLASRNLVLVAGILLPLITTLVLVGGSLLLGRTISANPPDNALKVRITGWMWWWEIEYLNDEGDHLLTTANELHIPVDRPVQIELQAGDVIHSFWVPELHGKTDMVPGKTNQSWFVAKKPGRFRGQCAEFCGIQHALMGFLVIAEPEDQYRQWFTQQTRSVQPPDNSATQRGSEIFLLRCASCHTVRGTDASGEIGPDLTHFASRQTFAAATRINNRGHLSGWIADPQGIKPGNLMPSIALEPRQLKDLVLYLESLQ